MARKAALIVAASLFTMVMAFGLGSRNAYAAAKTVDCTKVMAEVAAGKKAKDIATDLKISTSSVYRCKKKAAAAKGTKTAAATPMPSASASPAHK